MKIDLAKKDDIQQLKTDIVAEIKHTNEKVGALTSSFDAAHKNMDTDDDRITNLEKNVQETEHAEPAPPQWTGPSSSRRAPGRTSTSSRTGASSTQHATDEERRARIIQWRGSAPYGSGDSSNINSADAEQVRTHHGPRPLQVQAMRQDAQLVHERPLGARGNPSCRTERCQADQRPGPLGAAEKASHREAHRDQKGRRDQTRTQKGPQGLLRRPRHCEVHEPRLPGGPRTSTSPAPGTPSSPP